MRWRPAAFSGQHLRALHGSLPPLIGQSWARRSGRRPRRFIDERRRGRLWRLAALALAAVEAALLAALVSGPALQVRHVDVSGARRLTAAQVVALAGLARPGSVLTVDPGSIRRRLAASPWVRTSAVTAVLPDRVRVQVDEWQPVAIFRAGGGRPLFLSEHAVVLGVADVPAAAPDPAGPQGSQPLLEVEGPPGQEPKAGRAALEPRLLVALVNIQRQLPGLIGQEVRSFTIDGCGNLTMNSRRGWKALFGRMLTPEEYAGLRDKVEALRSLQAGGQVNYNSPKLQYVNVMNPAAVAVNDGSVRPARPAASPAAQPSPPPASPATQPSPPPARPEVACR